MKENDELKEKINKEFSTPEKPFEEWAKENGIFAEPDERSAAVVPVYELADNVNGRGVSGNNKRKKFIVSLVIVLLATAGILLGIFLPRGNANNLPKVFGANDAVTLETELEEITSREDIYLFDMTKVFRTEFASKDVLKSDNNYVLLYTLNRCLLSVENGGASDAFYVTYRIRTYPNYEFYNIGDYAKLTESVAVNNLKIDYKLTMNESMHAYASFKVDNKEYYLEAYGMDGITVLNEENFINLLNKILL